MAEVSPRHRHANELFAPLGPTYDRYARLLSFGQDPRWRRFLVSRLDVGPGDTVLDVATGTGAVAAELVRRTGCAVVGIDQSPEMLDEARRRVPEQADTCPRRRGTASVPGLVVRRADRHLSAPLRGRSGGDIARAVARGPTRCDDRVSRVRRSAQSGGAGGLGAPCVCRPPGARSTDLARMGRGRPVSRSEHQAPVSRAAAPPPARALARRRNRGRLVPDDEPRRRDCRLGPEGMTRPAFYALAPGGWRDYVTLLHPPYTLWNLSYVVIGAALAPEWRPLRLGAALVAFFLGLGVGAHALDELHGRPLRTRIPDGVLWMLAGASLAGAVGIGIAAAVLWTPWLAAFVAFGGFITCAYNLELLGGRFHSGAWLAISWAGLPILSAYLVSAGNITWQALAAAAFGCLLILAQRRLSTPVRHVRRRLGDVDDPIRAELVRGAEGALQAMAAAVVCLAVALVILRAR